MRVVIAAHEGSSPREAGAAMLVWEAGQSGTIGGGALEWQALGRARALLGSRRGPSVERAALGPALGQCCGGAVTLVYERLDSERLAALSAAPGGIVARPVAADAPAAEPLAVQRLRAAARNGRGIAGAQLVQGWLVEPLAAPARPAWIWGAGHVGRAVVAIAAPHPGLSITWVDCDMSRFPATIPDGVAPLAARNPADLVRHAPPDASHVILTYSHELDLELCHRLLQHGFAAAGLIGSASKWARFRSRLRRLGHDDADIAGIACPIGDRRLGKHPQAIAVGVVAGLLAGEATTAAAAGRVAG